MYRRAPLFFIVVMLVVAKIQAVEPAKIARPTVAIDWNQLPGTDGKLHSLSDLKEKDVIVVAVTCNHCPIAIEYYERMKQFVSKSQADGKCELVAVAISNTETDRLPRMIEMAKSRGFNFPYLHDESQQLAKDLNAVVTPQFFVLDQARKVVYRGAFDDNVNPAKVTARYLEEAVDAVVHGRKPATPETKARGCMIVFDKKN